MKTRLLVAPLFASLAASVTAAERKWDGDDATTSLTAAANWDGNAALNLATDDLNFPTGVPANKRAANNNYAANTVFRTVNFLDSGYTLSGTVMGITSGVTGFFAAGGVTIQSSFALQNAQTFAINGGGDMQFGGGSQIFLNDFNLNLQAAHVDSVMSIDGLLSGSAAASLRVLGAGEVHFNGAKTFSSGVTVDGGRLFINNNGGLGSAAGVTTLTANGSLILDNAAALSVAETIRMANTGQDFSTITSRGGAHTLTGGIEMSGAWYKHFNVEGPSLTLSGVVSGAEQFGSFDKTGPGKLIFSGAAANTTGIQIFNIAEGEVLLSKPPGVVSLSSPFIQIGVNSLDPDKAILRLGTSQQISSNSRVDIGSDGWFDLNGHQESIESLMFRGRGHVTTNGGSLRLVNGLEALSAAQNGGTAVVSGPVFLESPVQEWKVYGGTLNLVVRVDGPVTAVADGTVLTKTEGGQIQFTGDLSVPTIKLTAGSIVTTGNSPDTNVEVTDGVLYGAGTLGDITCTGGVVSAGTDAQAVTLNCGNLSVSGPGVLRWSYTGANPGEYDRMNVNGTVVLNDAQWTATGPGLPNAAPGTEVVIINNDGTDPIQGQFHLLPEGTIIGGLSYSYHGGDGNDFTMTKIIPPTGTTRLWDGGGADDNWMTPNNWNPNGMPQEGDDLVFPTVAQRKDNLNNYPAGTTFNSITVHGSNYNIGGNRITLNQKLDFTSPNGSPTWSADLTLALDVTLSITGTTFLQTDSLIDTNGHDLILHNATAQGGDVYLSGTISGSGGVRKTGPGAITFFDWPHTYTGPTSVEAGTLALSYQATLGGAQSGTTVAAGATLQFRNSEDPMTCSENITLYGRLMDTGGQTLQINGSLAAAADTATIESSDNGMFLNGAISGSMLHKAGTGGITIAGMTANTLSGGMFVDAGELRLQKAVGNALECPVIIGNAGVAAKVTLAAPNQLNDNGTVQIVHPSGVLDIGAHSDTIAALVMNGGTLTGTAAGRLTLQTLAVNANDATAVVAAPIVRAAAGGVLQVANGNASPDLRFDSVVYGTAFEKQGAGRMDLMAAIPVEGLDLLKITSGSALFFANCRYTNVELAGGTVGGQGVAGNITALSGGTVSPGTDSSAGGLGGYAGSWNAGTTMRVELNGLNPGSEFDQYAAFGTLTLGGSKLALTAGFTPAPGDSFMIVRNVSGAAIGGTFAGIPEGGYVSAPGAKVFQVTYKGGDGDDVVLTSVEVAPPVLVSHGMTPGTGPHEGENDTHMTVKGTPGLAYQLEFSTDLANWTAGDSKVADLQTGLMEFEFFNNENDPRLFLRVRLP